MERLFTIKDAAQALGGVSTKTVEAWLSNGRLRRTKCGRRTFVAESALRDFIQVSTAAAEITRSRAAEVPAHA